MTDDDKDKNTPEDHHDEFEEEFAFDSDVTDTDEFLEEKGEETATEAEKPVEAKPKGSVLPLLIGLVILGYLGWKVYHYFFPKLPPIENAQITPVPEQTGPSSEAPIKLPSQEMPQGLSAQGFDNQKEGTATPATAPAPTITPAPSAAPTPESPAGSQAPAPAQPSGTTSSSILLPPPRGEKPSTIPSLEQPGPPPLSQAPRPAAAQTETIATPRPRIEGQTLSSPSDAMSRLEKKMEEQEQTYKQQIQLLESDLAKISQSSAHTYKGIDSLQQDVHNLSNAVKILTEQIRSLKQPPKPATKPKESAPSKPKKKHQTPASSEAIPSLCVYAIIPGRAWLKTTSGKTITVSEGDTIAEFGRVLKIDAGNALVVTSSGVIIR